MCSITKHCTLAPLVACEPSADRSVTRVYLLSCLQVYKFTSLQVTGLRAASIASLSSTVIRRKGAVIREGRLCNSLMVASLVDTRSVACVSVTMKQCVSVSMCTHYTFKKVRSKKNLIKRQGFFHKPNQVCQLVELLTLGSGGSRWIFL